MAVLTLALGIGANTAVFSIVNAVLLRPLAYPHPDRIVTLSASSTKTGGYGLISTPDFHDWHDQSTAFAAMAYYSDGPLAVTSGSDPSYAHVATVSPEFFRVFEEQPIAGRLFTSDEQKPGSDGAAVISHAYWQNHFAGSLKAMNQPVHMLGRTLNIVGVMPQGFQFPDQTDIWFPTGTIISDNTERSSHDYLAVGRLKDGISLRQAQTQMASIGARLEREYPLSNANATVAVLGLRDAMVADVRLTLYLLLGAVGLVLLIACANTGSLMLARATARSREMAVRAALGASRSRIVRQLMTESLLLALLAGSGGLWLAYWLSRALMLLAPSNVPRLDQTGVDGPVLAFTFGVSVIASILFGIAPAVQVSGLDLNKSLNQGATRSVVRGGAGRLRTTLVVAEIALAVVLLAGAGVLLKSFVALHNVVLGFRPEHVLVMETSVPASTPEQDRRALGFYKDLLLQVRELPAVSAAGATRTLPGKVDSFGTYWIDHLPQQRSVNGAQAIFSVVAAGTFRTIGIPLRRGRDFSDNDTYEPPFTAIVNESFAKQAFPGDDPIGHLIYCGFDSDTPMKIVGIVGDVRQYGPASNPQPEIFMPYEQHPGPSTDLNILVRTTGDPGFLANTMRREAHELMPEVPVKFTTLEAAFSEHFILPRFRTLLLGIFAGLAVCLAMAGVYVVTAYVVGQRQNEIGLRMALV